jgi:hypothetical protein
MRTLLGFCVASLISTALFAQGHSGFVQPLPGITTGGSVVHPGGTSSMPGVQRTTGSVVNPGGNTPQIGYPGVRQQGVRRTTGTASYAYPVYVGGYGYGYGYSGYDTQPVQQATVQSTQPNVIVIYPQAPPQPQIYYQPAPPPQSSIIEVPQQRQQEQTEATHYLVAFKDHSIYSAVAYWIDGDTIHYMVSGNLHKQAPVSSIDRELTARLNEGSGLEIKLPAAK